jgi:metal-dependent amidase/aminoacylase/carboxypeptidase family protein
VRNYPPTINTPPKPQFARKVMASIVGEDNVLDQEPTMGAEDFAYMLQAKPGAYCSLPTATAATAKWATAAGPARCTTPATTSMTT